MKRVLPSAWLVACLCLGLLINSAVTGANASANDAEVVVLLHGLGRNNTAMWSLAGRIEKAGYEVHRVGYRTYKTDPAVMIDTVTEQINVCCLNEPRRVHFVGHSLGGLLIRAYLQDHRPPKLGYTVLVGTPNNGTAAADRVKDQALIEQLVPAATQLGTDPDSLPNRLPLPDYPVGIIAGVVDRELSNHFLPGPNDGVVPVESTRLEGMRDFVEIETGHSMMRYDKEVANQVIHFLAQGRFARP